MKPFGPHRGLPAHRAYVASIALLWCGIVGAAPDPDTLKVCADPYNLPFSNKEEQGFENAIASLMADKMGLPLHYTWFPQRRGFIRNTLKSELHNGVYKCDLVIGVSDQYEQAATTRPYYASTYVLAFAVGRGLDELENAEQLGDLDEAARKKIRFGIFDLGPGQIWAYRHGLMGHAVPYVGRAGHQQDSLARVLDDILADKIDATVVWGPFAGYYATKKAPGRLKLLPLVSDPEDASMRYHFSISMATRYREPEWKQRVNDFITRNQEEIHGILIEYGVPLLPVE